MGVVEGQSPGVHQVRDTDSCRATDAGTTVDQNLAARLTNALCTHTDRVIARTVFTSGYSHFGHVVEWLASPTCNQQVAGSNLARRADECNPRQVVHNHVPVAASPQPQSGMRHLVNAYEVEAGTV